MLDFDEVGSVPAEELIGFRSSFDGSGLAAEGTDVDAFGSADADDLRDGGFAFVWLPGADAQALVA